MLRKVLVIDDDPDIRRIADLSLTRIGKLEVVIAWSGVQGLELAAREKPDAILCDVMMPGMDGPTTLERLRADPATAAIPVVFMTARSDPREIAALRALGAAGVIVKPFEPSKLAAQVRRLVEGE